MILHKKNFLCKDVENQLKSYHNKIEWVNFVLMQDSWPQLKSDSISWQKTLKNSHNSQIQWPVVSTLCQETRNTKFGPVLEVTTCCLQGKYGVEIRIKSVNKDHSHSWVRISHGLNKLVTNLNNKEQDDNEQETSEMQFEEFALKTNVLAFASRSKAKAKPRRRTSACSSTRTILICERSWTDIEPETYSPIAFPVWNNWVLFFVMVIHLPREEDGAIEFGRLKDFHRNEFEYSQHWSDEMWKSKMAGGGGNKKIFHFCTDPSGQEILNLRALQGHSGRNPIDPSLQDDVLIPNNFFEYIYHIGCAINLHSITNSGLIPGGQYLSNRQTVFFTSVDPMNKEHIDPNNIDLEAPRLAWYKQKKWKKHQNTVYWVDIQLAQQKGFKFYLTRSNAVILYDTFPAYCIPKAIMMVIGEIIYEKVYASPRTPPKISFKDYWMKELGSEVVGGSADSQQNPTNIKNPNYQARWDLWRVSNHLVRLLRRSKKMSCLAANAPT